MSRWFRLSMLLVAFVLASAISSAQIVIVTGRIAPNDVRVFVRDSVYQIAGTYTVAGTLVIEPGTRVEFTPNGSRIIDSVGGRIIADGRARMSYQGTQFASVTSPRNAYDYSDPVYFFSNLVTSRTTQIEPTIADSKRDVAFHVILDTLTRRIENLPAPPVTAQGLTYPNWPNSINPAVQLPGFVYPAAGTFSGANNTKFVVPYEFALMWTVARLANPTLDPSIRTLTWRRNNFASVQVGGIVGSANYDRIKFVGKPVNNVSREWGHIIIMPGARAAFFRDCDFENFRKDTTVDRFELYSNSAAGSATDPNSLNYRITSMTNGSGGVLSILSSRTWLVNCAFRNNMARYHGGAVQLLQAPNGGTVYPQTLTSGTAANAAYNALPASYEPTTLGASASPAVASVIANQYLTEQNAATPTQLLPVPMGPQNLAPVRAHDNLYYPGLRELEDENRQAVDDGRLAAYLGRIRQLTFTNNKVVNADIKVVSTSTGSAVVDDTVRTIETSPANAFKNDAFGGAVYMSGRWMMEVGLGINDFQGKDYVTFDGNMAHNLQGENSGTTYTGGAKGGAIYVANQTALTLNGRFRSNETHTPQVKTYAEAAFSQGGAVYMSSVAGRLQLRGGQDVAVPTHFIANMSGRGGAIYVDENFAVDANRPSPQIGGSNAQNILVRNLGYNIQFVNNNATFDGGALFTKRNMLVNGAGGVVGGVLTGYTPAHKVLFSGNKAGLSGGAVAIHENYGVSQPERIYNRVVRANFFDNIVGENVASTYNAQIRGGGAIYVLNAELQTVVGTEFRNNSANGGNGGAIAFINPRSSFNATSNFRRIFATDIDAITYNSANPAFVDNVASVDGPFTFDPTSAYPPDVRMLTRFLDNKATANTDTNRTGNGASQVGSYKTFHPGLGSTSAALSNPDRNVMPSALPENGTGLGGAIYILDSIKANRAGRVDSVFFNRVRIQNNTAVSGAAVYSDNYDLKLVLLRNLITNNTATSTVGNSQNAITGPLTSFNGAAVNPASSDLAGAILYGEVIGPVPFASFSTAGNSIYDNNGRFLIRLPDAPDTKGLFAGLTGVGYGGTDTLRGNYWGKTEANLTTKVYRYDSNGDPADSINQNTFFVAGDGTQQLRFVRGGEGKDQGPFESDLRYSYTPIPVLNGADANTAAASSIPERLLQQGRVYDVFDKGADIKTADYSARRMSPIEDFAVGIPTLLRKFTDARQPSNGKYVKRYTRDPFVAEVDANINSLQTEFKGDHPIGYPLFLEASADYTSIADANLNNNDVRSINETVFYVINLTTGDYIRTNMQQVDATSEVYRSRVDIVPDSTQLVGISYAERRNSEFLANFGSDLSSILNALKRNAENEDAGTLQGRKYSASAAAGQLGGNGFTLSNRATLPVSNGGQETYFAGERYRTIPAKVGDDMAIVSRSALWREGVLNNGDAFSAALRFKVSASTPAPVWTGNQPQIANPVTASGTPVPAIFRDKIFVSEDRSYPRDANDGSRALPGRDTIIAITARDTNKFYDPRSIYQADNYSELDYSWSVAANTGLARWIKADTIRASAGFPLNPWYQAKGYIVLKGQPSNPYVVPGGEDVTISARNFPPNWVTIDSMKKAGITDDIIAKYIYLYPSYFANGTYDATNARFLQQDTVNVGGSNEIRYTFKVFVTDSLPVFTQSVVGCGNQNQYFANLTDKLRFKLDVNTDDEAEDKAAEATGWDFQYGRTSYGFQSVSRVDNVGDTTSDNVSLVRPSWLSNRYLRKYDNSQLNDENGADFISEGKLNISIDSAEAMALLTPIGQVNNALNTDTVMTIVANDGHSGVSRLTRRIIVNLAPTILTTSLPDATEDVDYNSALLDSNKRITVSDANFGQKQKYELIYGDDSRKATGIDRDPCFPEAGKWDIANANTPKWLQVNDISGLLYGTPRVKDAAIPDTNVVVTVLVTDEGGLTHVKTINLKVIGVNHGPDITNAPAVRCAEVGSNFSDSVWVKDVDLSRTETVTLRVLSPSGFTVSPSTINGPNATDSVRVAIVASNFQGFTPFKDTTYVTIEATDAAGLKKVFKYKLNISEPSRFTVPMTISNNRGAFETMVWGTGANATTGDNPQAGGIGKLDSNYCEYEIPSIPPLDVFDARWIIPSTNGTLRNIFPNCATNATGIEIYKGRFQAGRETGGGAYPVRISWNLSDVPSKTDAQKNPCGGQWFIRDAVSNGNLFSYEMSTGVGRNTGDYPIIINGNQATIEFRTEEINQFVIIWDKASPVETPSAGDALALYPNTPNPFTGETTIQFAVPTASHVNVEVVDNLGNSVATVANGMFSSGLHSMNWNGRNANGIELPSGTYTLKMTSGAFSTVQRMVIVR